MHRNKNASPLPLDSYPKETKLKKVIKIKYPDERISALLRKRPGFSWEDLSSPPTPLPHFALSATSVIFGRQVSQD